MISLKIYPRQVGKTTKIIEIFKQNPDNTIILSSHDISKHIKKMLGYSHKNLVSSLNHNKTLGIDLILIDEILYLNKEQYLKVKEICDNRNIDIIGYSSVDMIYKVKNYLYVKNNKHLNYKELLLQCPHKYDELELYNLYHSFLTDYCDLYIDDVEIYSNNTILRDESFKSEYLNILFKL